MTETNHRRNHKKPIDQRHSVYHNGYHRDQFKYISHPLQGMIGE